MTSLRSCPLKHSLFNVLSFRNCVYFGIECTLSKNNPGWLSIVDVTLVTKVSNSVQKNHLTYLPSPILGQICSLPDLKG